MNEKTSSLVKKCEYCKLPLHGRSDQRFCNDTCRNTYNRNKRADEKINPHSNASEIFKIIKSNYEVLKRGNPGVMDDSEGSFYAVEDFFKSGINPKFFTSIYQDKDGETWCCVFDRCYSIGVNYVLIRDFPEQAEI